MSVRTTNNSLRIWAECHVIARLGGHERIRARAIVSRPCISTLHLRKRPNFLAFRVGFEPTRRRKQPCSDRPTILEHKKNKTIGGGNGRKDEARSCEDGKGA